MRRLGFLAGLCLIALSLAPASTQAAQEIKPFVRGSYQQIISARQGKPFILSFWSLTCSYCMVELDMLKTLARKYPRLDLVLVSTDTPEEEDSVAATLEKIAPQRAETWLFADSNSDRLRYEIDKRWYGELPRTYFFGADGKTDAYSGKLEQKDVEQWIKKQYGFR